MTVSLAQDGHQYSPAEMILSLKDQEILRLNYQTKSDSGDVQSVELFIWICPQTSFFTGIYVIDDDIIKPMSERQLNSQQLLLLINNTPFQPGVDIIEISHKADMKDLQRLHKLVQHIE